MISIEKPGSPEEVLEHLGVKGMRWGVRKAVDTAIGTKTAGRKPSSYKKKTGPPAITKTKAWKGWSKVVQKNVDAHNARVSRRAAKPPMSTKKKVAIGVGVGVAVVGGAAIAGHILGSRGKLRISDIDGGKDNLIRFKNGKGAISTLSHEQWNQKISNAKASYKSMDIASRSIAARRKAGHPGYRPGEMLGRPAGSSILGFTGDYIQKHG